MERIIVDRISKQFKIGCTKEQSVLGSFISLFSGIGPTRVIWALRGVSFAVGPGEIVGIIGKNGSGKSTLLRLIAGIYDKSCGRIKTWGKVAPLINLNLGMYQYLTMRDNIYFISSFFGLSRGEMAGRFNLIARFSELEDFLDAKICQFSEGMRQRLVFSIAVHSCPQILLLDEVFEVGDKEFRIKSARKIKELVAGGGTVVLVSHNLDLIEKYCDRAIWLEEGKVKDDGPAAEVVEKYKGSA